MRGQNRIKIPDQIIADIETERCYALKYWDQEFDSKNTINDWAAYINVYLARAIKMRKDGEPVEQQRSRQRSGLIKVANLAIAALEAFDENDGFQERHYD